MEQDSNPHLLNAKHILFLKLPFYDDSRRLDVRSMNIHMSRVNFDKQ